MGDLTLTDRVYALEDGYGRLLKAVEIINKALSDRLGALEDGVVLVEKRKPGPAVKSVSKSVVKRGPRGGVSRRGPQLRRGFVKSA